MDAPLYYTAPSEEVFEEVKTACIAIRAAYAYNEEKVAQLQKITNFKDNFMYLVAKFDMHNQAKLSALISNEASLAIGLRMIDGGTPIMYIPFKTKELEPDTLVCESCGSDQIQRKEWMWVNTGEFASIVSDGESEDNWCTYCEVHGNFVTHRDFTESEATDEQV